jgi:hypothetical protein
MFEDNFDLQANMLNNNDTNETSRPPTEKTPQIRRPAALSKRLHRLMHVLKLEQSNRKQLKGLFCPETKTKSVYATFFQNELAFSFWGFVKSDDTRGRLLDFLNWLFNPRVYMTATTRGGNFLEGIMIISLHKLEITRDAFELWVECFFETLQMSAGTLVFTEYLGEQMLSCMQRVHQSDKFRSNLFAEHNKDFRLLYQNLIQRRNDNNKVLQVTGLHFTTFNFTNMFGNLTSRESENRQTLRLNAAADWNWRILVGTVDQIHREAEIAEQNTVL